MKSMKTVVLRSCGALFTMLAAVALTGCAAEDVSSRNAAPETATPPTESSDAEQPGAGEDEGFSSQADCLTGEWLANNAGLKAIVEGFAAVDGGSIDDISGEVLLTFDGGDLTSTAYTDWTFAMTVEGVNTTLVRNGTDSGTYAVEEDSKLTMQETMSDSTIDMSINGVGTGSVPTTNTLPLSSAPFTCSDTLLTIETPDAVIEMTRR